MIDKIECLKKEYVSWSMRPLEDVAEWEIEH